MISCVWLFLLFYDLLLVLGFWFGMGYENLITCTVDFRFFDSVT